MFFMLLNVSLNCCLPISFSRDCKWGLCFRIFLFIQLVQVEPVALVIALPPGSGESMPLIDVDISEAPPGISKVKAPVAADAVGDSWGCGEVAPRP